MKRLIYFALVLAFQLNHFSAYASSPLKYLYVVTSPEGEISYLFGTIHSGVPFREIPDRVKEIILSAKRLVLESNEYIFTEAIQYVLETEAQQKTNFITKHLKALSLNDLIRHVAKNDSIDWHSIPLNGLSRYEYIKNNFNSPIKLSKFLNDLIKSSVMRKNDQTYVLDYEIRNYYVTHWEQSSIHYLDTIDIYKKIIYILYNPSDILTISKNYKDIIKGNEATHRLYRNGELLDILVHNFIFQGRKKQNRMSLNMNSKEADDFLINYRNKDWLPKLKEAIDAGEAFIAFGLAHLHGVITLLENEGYEVSLFEPK